MKQNNYNTKQKSAIMNCIKKSKDKHFTVDDVCEILVKSGDSVGRTTVYRYLQSLSQEGILRKYAASQGESVCYQYVGEQNDCPEHFHLKCEQCGKLIHMECDEMNELVKHINSHHGFCLNPLKTVIYGTCEECSVK